MAILLRLGEDKQLVEPENKEQGFRLKELYEMLECKTVEVIPTLIHGYIMIIDEEGKLQNNWEEKINYKASKLYPYGGTDPVVGHVLICKEGDFR